MLNFKRASAISMAMASDDEDETLARFLESEIFSQLSDQENLDTIAEADEPEGVERDGKRVLLEEKEKPDAKKIRIDESVISDEGLLTVVRSSSSSSIELEAEVEPALSPLKERDIVMHNNDNNGRLSNESRQFARRVGTGSFSQIPPELLFHILKFLSSEDLVSCSLVCRFLKFAAADESLWHRLYCMRWGILPSKKVRDCAWKKLYIQHDKEDVVEFTRNGPSEFKEYYVQMQVARRSQAPHPSLVNDDRIILDKTLADQVSMWKSSRGLAEVDNHACSGDSCTYHQIGDVFICEKTGNVHVCDDTCRELFLNSVNELLVCTISGRCSIGLISPAEVEPDAEQQQVGVTDEAESFMESGRFDKAYIYGYNCEDEKELEAAWRFC